MEIAQRMSIKEAFMPIAELKSMGDLGHESVSGLDAGLANAKSWVSCAIDSIF
jgi:hypothetical protein